MEQENLNNNNTQQTAAASLRALNYKNLVEAFTECGFEIHDIGASLYHTDAFEVRRENTVFSFHFLHDYSLCLRHGNVWTGCRMTIYAYPQYAFKLKLYSAMNGLCCYELKIVNDSRELSFLIDREARLHE